MCLQTGAGGRCELPAGQVDVGFSAYEALLSDGGPCSNTSGQWMAGGKAMFLFLLNESRNNKKKESRKVSYEALCPSNAKLCSSNAEL